MLEGDRLQPRHRDPIIVGHVVIVEDGPRRLPVATKRETIRNDAHRYWNAFGSSDGLFGSDDPISSSDEFKNGGPSDPYLHPFSSSDWKLSCSASACSRLGGATMLRCHSTMMKSKRQSEPCRSSHLVVKGERNSRSICCSTRGSDAQNDAPNSTRPVATCQPAPCNVPCCQRCRELWSEHRHAFGSSSPWSRGSSSYSVPSTSSLSTLFVTPKWHRSSREVYSRCGIGWAQGC